MKRMDLRAPAMLRSGVTKETPSASSYNQKVSMTRQGKA